jgi:biotin carboxyl carrier protein
VKAVAIVTESALDDLPDRIVVATSHGRIVVPLAESFTTEGEVVRAGQLLARVEATERSTDVHAPCDAWVLGYLVRDGERVSPGMPLVHLRAL